MALAGFDGSPTGSARYIELASIDVEFAGSGAAASASAHPCNDVCPIKVAVGTTFYTGFSVLIPGETICYPHEYSVTQLQGPISGAFVVSAAKAVVTANDSGLPVTIPYCSSAGDSNGATIGFDLTVVDSGPEIQTLVVVVSVVQVSEFRKANACSAIGRPLP